MTITLTQVRIQNGNIKDAQKNIAKNEKNKTIAVVW